jgi:hypothetical protein
MRASTGTRLRHWLLLCALVLAVVGMHHVALAPHGTSHAAPSSEAHVAAMPAAPAGLSEALTSSDPTTDGGHDLLHLCLAVLAATGGLLLLVLLLGAGEKPRPLLTTLAVTRLLPPPKPAGRSLLTSVCVMRT